MEQLHVTHLQFSLLTVPKELCVVEEMNYAQSKAFENSYKAAHQYMQNYVVKI